MNFLKITVLIALIALISLALLSTKYIYQKKHATEGDSGMICIGYIGDQSLDSIPSGSAAVVDDQSLDSIPRSGVLIFPKIREAKRDRIEHVTWSSGDPKEMEKLLRFTKNLPVDRTAHLKSKHPKLFY